MGSLRVAVVGHVEWTTIVRVDRLPAVGEICSTRTIWQGPAGGGAVAAVRLAALAGSCTFLTALGADAEADLARQALAERGVQVVAARRDGPTSRAVSLVDGSGERTTLTIGERLAPAGHDPLDWTALGGYDAVYFTAGDVPALRLARAAAVLVATSREAATVRAAGVALDALVGSANDPDERCRPGTLPQPPGLLVFTDGARGGRYFTASGCGGRYPAEPPSGELADTYGVGDNFAAALTAALGSGMAAPDALRHAARCGADTATVRGPYDAERLALVAAAVPG